MQDLKQEIRHALDNATLGKTLGTFCKTYPSKREKAYEGIDFPAVREVQHQLRPSLDPCQKPRPP
ncbi:MAG: hypothetical protein K2O74_02565, partial [Eubacteriales bacterium]|nr:hypothetical protein [Eubacteriales bacterium]